MNGTITVHLVRHAESVWNVERRYQGQADSGLTERGHRQADQLGEAMSAWVPTPDLVISSDLPRALATSAPYAAHIGASVRTMTALREASVGDWSGRAFTEIASAHPETVAALRAGADLPRGGGETYAQVRARFVAGLAGVLDQLRATGGDRTAAVFTHGGPIRLAVAAALGIPSPGHRGLTAPDNCSVTTVEHREDGAAELVRYNHLLASARSDHYDTVRRDTDRRDTDGQML